MVNFKDKFIFLISGGNPIDYRECLNSVEVYSVETDTWASAPSLNTARMSHSSCVLKDTIYTFCGSSYTLGDMASIERMNARDFILGKQGSAAHWELI